MIAIPLMQRVAPPRRPFVWLALLLISASGLFAGVVLRTLTPLGTGLASTTSGNTSPGITATATTATNLVVTTPRAFKAFLCPATVARGATLTLTAYATTSTITARTVCANAQLPSTALLADGVTCTLTFPVSAGISMPPVQTTDSTGTTTWQIAIPATTAPGAVPVMLTATWGSKGFKATWKITVTVT